jgi:tetraacyldisaccharide 4'-kinase
VAWAEKLESAAARLWWRPRLPLPAWMLLPLCALYRAVIALRSILYALGWLRAQPAPVPVLVVGNLVAGGAGKTPTVIALVQALRRAGRTPGVISRGHGRRSGVAAAVHAAGHASEVGDEPLLIHRRTGAPVWVARRRIDAARGLCGAHPEVDLLLCDDGLQHLALARDVQVIVFDERGIGNGHVLPAGPLRQPMTAQVPVNSHVLYNAPLPSTHWPGALARRQLAGAVALADWWQGAAPNPGQLLALRGRKLLAVAGMAAPQRFFAMLREAGLAIDTLPLPDHHDYARLPWPTDTADVVLTEKDAVKLPHHPDTAARVWVVTLDFQMPEDFTQAVLDNLHRLQRP